MFLTDGPGKKGQVEHIGTISSGACLGRLEKNIFGDEYMGKDDNRNGSENPHKEIKASIMRIYGFSRDADIGYTCTAIAGTFYSRPEKKIFGNEYMGRDNKAMTLNTVWGVDKWGWFYKNAGSCVFQIMAVRKIPADFII